MNATQQNTLEHKKKHHQITQACQTCLNKHKQDHINNTQKTINEAKRIPQKTHKQQNTKTQERIKQTATHRSLKTKQLNKTHKKREHNKTAHKNKQKKDTYIQYTHKHRNTTKNSTHKTPATGNKKNITITQTQHRNKQRTQTMTTTKQHTNTKTATNTPHTN